MTMRISESSAMRGIVGDEDEDLAVRAQQLESARAVDAGVLDLVEQHDGRVADDGASAISSARVWPPESSVMRLVR